jgi:hypothetical protein
MHKISNNVNPEKMKTICQTSLQHYAERQYILIRHSFHFLVFNVIKIEINFLPISFSGSVLL